jgi:hypothetical protein
MPKAVSPRVARAVACCKCEPRWDDGKPIESCCCCIGPLRTGAAAAMGCTSVFSLALLVYLLAVSLVEEKASDSTILLIEFWVHALVAVVMLVGSTATFCLALWSPHGMAATLNCFCLGRTTLALLMSRLLRLSMWLAVIACFTTLTSSRVACRREQEPFTAAESALACKCYELDVPAEELSAMNLQVLEQICSPKQFRTCLPRLEASGTDCQALCQQGDSLTHDECTEEMCARYSGGNCAWETYTCPERRSEFTLGLKHPHRYCNYGTDGWLLSTTVAGGFVTPTSELDEIMHEDLRSASLLAGGFSDKPALGTPTITKLSGSLSGPICTFQPGDGQCDKDSGTCSEKLLASSLKSEQEKWAKLGTHVQGPVNSEQECAALVVEREPSANGATYTAGDSLRQGDCYAEFGMVQVGDGVIYDETGAENDGLTWKTCFLEPTNHLFDVNIKLLDGGNVSLPAQCKLELVKLERDGLRSVETCEAVGTTIMLLWSIFIAVCSYHFSHVLYGLAKSLGGDGRSLGGVQRHVQMDEMATESNGVLTSDSTTAGPNHAFSTARP